MNEIADRSEPADTNDSPRRGLGSVDLAMRLLGVLSDAGAPMKLKDIAAAADMAPAKAHRYMASFLNCGMVAQDGPSGRYGLGPMAVRIGVAALTGNDVIERASTGLSGLRDAIRATCFVSCWSDRGPVIVRWEDSLRPITVVVQVGSTMPLLNSATGRTYLAFMAPSKLQPVLVRELASSGVTDAEAEAIAERTRKDGMGRVDETFQKGIAGLSVPLFDPLGNMAGAVTAMGSRNAFDIACDGSIAEKLKTFAQNTFGA